MGRNDPLEQLVAKPLDQGKRTGAFNLSLGNSPDLSELQPKLL
jgi:hypothetical protein